MSKFSLKSEVFSTWARLHNTSPFIRKVWTNVERATCFFCLFFLFWFPLFAAAACSNFHQSERWMFFHYHVFIFTLLCLWKKTNKKKTVNGLNMLQLDLSNKTQEASLQKQIESKEHLHLSCASMLFLLRQGCDPFLFSPLQECSHFTSL